MGILPLDESPRAYKLDENTRSQACRKPVGRVDAILHVSKAPTITNPRENANVRLPLDPPVTGM